MPKDSRNWNDPELREALAGDKSAVEMPVAPIVNVASEKEAPTAEPKPAPELKSPAEHARDLKGVKTVKRAARVNGEPEEFELFHWQHAAAEALHGWKSHEHHEAKPIALSLDDYKAALIAASAPVTRRITDAGALLKDDAGNALEPVNSHEAAKQGWHVVTDYEPHSPALSIHKDRG